MTDERPQPPQDEQAAANPTPEHHEPEKKDAPENMSYAEYLKLTHPDKSDEQIAKMIRKENRYVWVGRFQILGFILILIVILAFIFWH